MFDVGKKSGGYGMTHTVEQVLTWANDLRNAGGQALVVQMLDSYAGLLKARTEQLKYVQECIERAKLLPVWDNVPSSLHAELDNIFRGVALLSAQRQDSEQSRLMLADDTSPQIPQRPDSDRDPMDWPLPCDVCVGHGTFKKGVKLSALVARMKVLYEMATGKDSGKDAERMFPMQHPNLPIPWALAEIIYAGYSARYGTSQSLERLAERGGFGWGEVGVIYKDSRSKAVIDRAIANGAKP